MRDFKKFVLEQVLQSKKKVSGYYYIDVATEDDFIFHDGFCVLNDDVFININNTYSSYYIFEAPTENWSLENEDIYFGPIPDYSSYFEVCSDLGGLLMLDHFIISEDFNLVVYIAADFFISFSAKNIDLSNVFEQSNKENRIEYLQHSAIPEDDNLATHYWGKDWYKGI